MPLPVPERAVKTLSPDASHPASLEPEGGRRVLRGRALAYDAVARRVTIATAQGAESLHVPEGTPWTATPSAGDIVEVRVQGNPPAVATWRVLTRYRRDVPFPSPGADYYRLHGARTPRTELLHVRARTLRAIRAFFDGHGYLEVQVPLRVRTPGLEPQLVAQSVGRDYLITSPEYQMKRLLSGGLERIYFMGSCFRGDEAGPLHLSEFCMLEWYRAYADFDSLLEETEALVRAVAQDVNGTAEIKRDEGWFDLAKPFDRLTVAATLQRFGGFDLRGVVEAAELRRRAQAAGCDVGAAQDADYDQLFSRLLVDRVELRLRQSGAVFLTHFPTPLAALARRCDADPTVAERAELYVAGIELANGFAELTDPEEQLERLRADQLIRRRRGLPVHPIDERFIEALREGMPPAVGNALGVDRLVMLLAGVDDIRQVVTFAPDEL